MNCHVFHVRRLFRPNSIFFKWFQMVYALFFLLFPPFLKSIHPLPQRRLEQSMRSCLMECVGDKSVRFAAAVHSRLKASPASQTLIILGQSRVEFGRRQMAAQTGFRFSTNSRFPRLARSRSRHLTTT